MLYETFMLFGSIWHIQGRDVGDRRVQQLARSHRADARREPHDRGGGQALRARRAVHREEPRAGTRAHHCVIAAEAERNKNHRQLCFLKHKLFIAL